MRTFSEFLSEAVELKGKRGGIKYTTFHRACFAGKLDLVKQFVEAGADVNHVHEIGASIAVFSGAGDTALMQACAGIQSGDGGGGIKNLKVIEYLLKHGADPCVLDKFSGTAFGSLPDWGRDPAAFQAADMMMKRVKDAEWKKHFANVAMYSSISYYKHDNHKEYMKQLDWALKHGADVDDEDGTPLRQAVQRHEDSAYYDRTEMIKALLEHGAKIHPGTMALLKDDNKKKAADVVGKYMNDFMKGSEEGDIPLLEAS